MTQESLDRTIFEALRKAVVAAGYLPDVILFTGDPTGYGAEKDVLRASLPDKQLIEVFGVGSSESRDAKSVNKITIDRTERTKGSVGAQGVTKYLPKPAPDPTKPNIHPWDKVMYPGSTKDVMYDIRVITDTSKFKRLIEVFIWQALGSNMQYMKGVDNAGANTEDNFLLEYQNDADMSSTELIETMYSYKVCDVWLEDYRVIQADIAPIISTNLEIDLLE